MSLVIYVGSTDGMDAVSSALSSSTCTVTQVPPELAALSDAMRKADAIVDASMKIRITEQMISNATRLRVISCATTGADHIDQSALARRGIPLITLRSNPELLRDLTPAAELSWALMMACTRNLKGATKHTEAGGWTREAFPSLMLKGRTLGLIGCGRIGSWMARYGAAFGMNVVAHDPFQIALPDGVVRQPLEDLVSQSDFISVHVHLSDQTAGMISKDLINRFKPGSIFINTSRGAVVDEEALLCALVSGRIASAGLDVLTGEPEISNHPLVEHARRHNNLIITPHCGGFSPDSVRRVCHYAAAQVRQVLSS